MKTNHCLIHLLFSNEARFVQSGKILKGDFEKSQGKSEKITHNQQNPETSFMV